MPPWFNFLGKNWGANALPAPPLATYTPKMSYSVQYLIVVLDLGQKKSVKYLVKSGADVNAKDANGKSVLMWAGQNGDLKIVKTLIDNGANVHAVDVDGKTALMWSQKQ